MNELENSCDLKKRRSVLKDLRAIGILQDSHMDGLLGSDNKSNKN